MCNQNNGCDAWEAMGKEEEEMEMEEEWKLDSTAIF
jgi:hypothetical protein